MTTTRPSAEYSEIAHQRERLAYRNKIAHEYGPPESQARVPVRASRPAS